MNPLESTERLSFERFFHRTTNKQNIFINNFKQFINRILFPLN